MKAEFELEGIVIVPASSHSFQNADLYIFVENVIELDASSKTIDSFFINGIDHTTDQETRYVFKFPIGKLDGKLGYAIRSHIDIHQGGGKEYKVGDLITTRSYPISIENQSDLHILQVHPIK